MDARSASAMRRGFDDELYHRVAEYAEIGAFSQAERLAAETAERFHGDHEALLTDDDYWHRMRAAFSDREILELLVLVGYCIGVGRTLALLDIANDCELNLTRDPAEAERLPVVEP
jgi:alkylhydroperoxidase family enzyme